MVKIIQSFLGLANLYEKFIKGFLEMVKLFSNLLKKDLFFEWQKEQHRAFEDLKKSFCPPLC
jgi:hypothetical protein